MLSQPDKNFSDLLVVHDVETDIQHILKEFDKGVTCLKLAQVGNIFYILTTGGIDLDRSSTEVTQDTLEVVSHYDRALSSESKIIKYDASTDTVTDHVAANATYPPQPGSHYYTGFNNAIRTFDWEGIVPDSRGGFKIHGTDLYYRYATDSAFGIAKVSSTGTATALWGINKGDYYNHLKFDFDINTSGDVFFVYVEQSATGSSLHIKKRTAGGTLSDVRTITKTFSQLTDTAAPLPNQGGWFSGIHEVHLDGNTLYISAEIGRCETYYDSSDNLHLTRSQQKGAGSAIYSIDTVNPALSLTLVDGYEFAQEGARSFTSHLNRVYYLESPPEYYKFPRFNPDLSDTFSVGLTENVDVGKGNLKYIDSNGITDTGRMWYGNQPYSVTWVPLLSIAGSLYANVVFSNPDDILKLHSETSRVDNFQWIKYGNNLEFILEELPSGNVYDILQDIAKKLNAIIQVSNNRIELIEREVVEMLLNGGLTASASTLTYDSANLTVPSSGTVLINNEIIGYTGKTATTLTGLTRGIHHTIAAAHADDSAIIFIDTLIEPSDYISLNRNIDINRVYNVIQSPDKILESRDEPSITRFGERVFNLDLGLSRHDRCWTEYIFENYLEELKDVHNIVSLKLSPNFKVRLGDVATLDFNGTITPIRVVEVTYNRDDTTLQFRSIGREIATPVGPVSNYLSDGSGNYYSDGKGNYYGHGV